MPGPPIFSESKPLADSAASLIISASSLILDCLDSSLLFGSTLIELGEIIDDWVYFLLVTINLCIFFIDQPDHPHLGRRLVDRQQTCADHMVTTGVTPHVGHGAQSQCADGVVGVVAHQRRYLLAIHRLADVAVRQRRAVDGEPAIIPVIRERRHATTLVGDGQTLLTPPLLALFGLVGDFGHQLRRGVVGVEMIVVGLDVLRMVEVAVVTLSVVFPDEFPVGAHGVVDRPGDLCAIDTLWLEPKCISFHLRFLATSQPSSLSSTLALSSTISSVSLLVPSLQRSCGKFARRTSTHLGLSSRY